MWIFLDSNIYYDNWYLDSANFQLLSNFVNNSGSRMLMSNMVCQEVQNHQEKQMSDILFALNRNIKTFNQLNPEYSEFDLEGKIQPYFFKDILETKFENLDYISYANISQEAVGHRAVKKIRPFLEQDKGYRDTLIWLSLLEQLSSSKFTGEVIFINSNTTDFFEKNLEFFDDLKKDIASYELKCTFKIYLTLAKFLQERVVKEEHQINYQVLLDQHLMDVDQEIQAEITDYLNGISSMDFLELILKENQWYPHLPFVLSHKFEIVEGIEEPNLFGCKSISDDLFYINYGFNLRICEIAFDVSFYHSVERPEWMNRYFSIEEVSNGYRLFDYRRIDIVASFNYQLSSSMIEGFTIDQLRLRKY
ncbi:MAG: DUF4935 domain-containing protein [Flavobacteriales bacterium]|nr:MAG: DUF4935 domain-containing protein [Flavobacteriales bacterium]